VAIARAMCDTIDRRDAMVVAVVVAGVVRAGVAGDVVVAGGVDMDGVRRRGRRYRRGAAGAGIVNVVRSIGAPAAPTPIAAARCDATPNAADRWRHRVAVAIIVRDGAVIAGRDSISTHRIARGVWAIRASIPTGRGDGQCRLLA